MKSPVYNNTNSIKKIILSLLILVVGIASYGVYSYTRPEPNAGAAAQSESVKGVTNTIISQPKADPIWWNLDWKSTKRLAISNLTNGEVDAAKPVHFNFDHKSLVAAGKSKKDGTDLQVVFQNSLGETKPIDFQLENLDSENASIYFDLVEGVEAATKVYNYFLYFNNSEIVKNDFLQLNGLRSYNNNLTVELEEEINSPFVYTMSRKWVLKGDNLPVDYRNLVAFVNIRNDFNSADTKFSWEIENTNLKSAPSHLPSGPNTLNIDTASLKPGTYNLVLRLGKHSDTYEFKVSYPLYMTWTIDWEGMDVKEEYLKYMDTIANDNKMPMTHFFSPRIYILDSMSEQRRQYLTNWVKNRAAKYGDSIDMHLHMHHDFVEKAGVTPKRDISWSGFKDGYDVPTSVYSTEELEKIVGYGLQLFEQNGLKKPVGYRAGGWHIKSDGLKAIENLGFKYDSSGRESFSFGKNNMAVPWSLKATTRPYQISLSDQNSGSGNTMNLWEFPNNGSDSTNYPASEMLGKFKVNYKGEPLNDKEVITFLSHPQWFHEDKPRLEELFRETNNHLANADKGPVLYVTLDEVYNIWTAK